MSTFKLPVSLVVTVAATLIAAEKKPGPAGGDTVPPVQMLVPGFAVRTLPLELPAINAVRYRADGKIVALGYDGKVYLLSDTDGDGLEDKASPVSLMPPGLDKALGEQGMKDLMTYLLLPAP